MTGLESYPTTKKQTYTKNAKSKRKAHDKKANVSEEREAQAQCRPRSFFAFFAFFSVFFLANRRRD